MKTIAALILCLCSQIAVAAYPAGIWYGTIPDGEGWKTAKLYILPNGLYWGVVDVDLGDVDCPILVSGNLPKGGASASFSMFTNIAYLPTGSSCEINIANGDFGVWGNGVVSASSATSITWTIKTTYASNTFVLNLVQSYNQPSSLKLISGYWHADGTGYTEIVAPNGAFLSYDPNLGCITFGQYTIVDPSHNLYSFNATVSGCDQAAFNGSLMGAATLTKNGSQSVLERHGSWGTVGIATDSYDLLYYGH